MLRFFGLPTLLLCAFAVSATAVIATPPVVADTPHVPAAEVTSANESKLPASVKGKMAIFILVGQSNMVGHGPLKDSTSKPHERVFLFAHDYKWKPASEPLDDPAGQIDKVSINTSFGVGPGMAFGLDLVKNDPALNVGLVPCSRGGTPLYDFLKARGTGRDTLYGSAVYRAKQAQKVGKLAGVLFYQGEGDANAATNPKAFGGKWGEHFEEWVRDFRADVGDPNLPVVFAQLGTSESPRYVRWEEVKTAQAKVKIPNVVMIKTDDLKRQDGVHFTTPSYEEIGRRFARAFRTLTQTQKEKTKP